MSAEPQTDERASDRVILGTASVIGVLVFWELSIRLGLTDSRFFVAPSEVASAGFREVQLPRFWTDLRVSLFEFGTGYVGAAVLGVPLGILLGWYKRLSYFFEPLMNFLYAIPRIALLPLIILWLGLTVWSKVAVVFLGAWVTILLNTFHGVRMIEPRLLAVAQTYGASQRRIFTSVVLPGSVPFILAGLRLGIGRALIGVVIGELYAGNAGIGFMITIASHNLQIDRVLFGTFIFIALGLSTGEALRRVERRFAGWRQDLSVPG